jgi:hypothetical protein
MLYTQTFQLTDLELPFEAQAMTAVEISIDAASQVDITRAAIGQANAKLLKCAGKLGQEAIASLAEVSLGWVREGGFVKNLPIRLACVFQIGLPVATDAVGEVLSSG